MEILKIVLMAVDYEGIGEKRLLQSIKTNLHMGTVVYESEARTVEWNNTHPLYGSSWRAGFESLFAVPSSDIDKQMAIVDAMRLKRLERRLQNHPVENERRCSVATVPEPIAIEPDQSARIAELEADVRKAYDAENSARIAFTVQFERADKWRERYLTLGAYLVETAAPKPVMDDAMREKAEKAKLDLQAVFDNPQPGVEAAFKAEKLDHMSQPREWDDYTALFQASGYKQFRHGFDAATPPAVEAVQPKATDHEVATLGDYLPRRDVVDEIVLLSNVMRDHPQLKPVIGREALLMRCVRKALAAPAVQKAPDCGACPGDGSVCATTCKLVAESPVPAVQQAGDERAAVEIAVRALERLARTPGCGCSFPCRCNGDEWTRAELEGRMDVAETALAALRAARAAQPAQQPLAVPEYTQEIGEAGERYRAQFSFAHPLPAMWKWNELWDAMLAAAPAQAPTVPEGASEAMTNQQIREILHKYSRYMGQPEYYSDTEFACLQDVIGFARALLAQVEGK